MSDPYVVDANRCISYLTIENRDDVLSPEFTDHLENWIFGCDICQDVCPWNKFKRQSPESRYAPRSGVDDTPLSDWMELSLDEFRNQFRNSPIKRTKHAGLVRNAVAAGSRILDN
jgi:epoxyqueuosine reductase